MLRVLLRPSAMDRMADVCTTVTMMLSTTRWPCCSMLFSITLFAFRMCQTGCSVGYVTGCAVVHLVTDNGTSLLFKLNKLQLHNFIGNALKQLLTLKHHYISVCWKHWKSRDFVDSAGSNANWVTKPSCCQVSSGCLKPRTEAWFG